MSISTEEKDRYLRETAIVLAREGFQTGKTDTGKLRVLLDGAPLCEVTENGGITYRNEDITAKSAVTCVKTAAVNSMSAVLAFNRRAVCSNAGEGYIDTAVKVLIAVVLGALVLAGLYAILNDTVMPTVTQKITEMFSYNG